MASWDSFLRRPALSTALANLDALFPQAGARQTGVERKAGATFPFAIVSCHRDENPWTRREVIREGSFARSHNQVAAEEIVREGLKAFELREEMLEELAKSDPRKIALAAVVKRQTVVTNQWLADRLRMGSPSRVSRYCSGTRGGNDVAKWIGILEMAIRKN